MIIYIISGALIVLLAIIVILVVKLNRPREDLLLHQKIDSIREEVSRSILKTHTTILSTQEGMTSELTKLYKEIGNITRDNAAILDLSKSFHDVLKPTKKIGGVGESILEAILKEVLPQGAISAQHTFRSGKKVDFAIKLPDCLIPIDAKFSLESFRNYLNADEADKERTRKAFIDATKKRVDETASYIYPDEGTVDFSFMYVPSAAVYYSIITETNLLEYAHKKNVYITGPNTFYVYLRSLLVGFKALTVQKQAKVIYEGLRRLELEVGGLLGDHKVLGKHLKDAAAKYEDVRTRMENISFKVAQINKGQE